MSGRVPECREKYQHNFRLLGKIPETGKMPKKIQGLKKTKILNKKIQELDKSGKIPECRKNV